MSHPNGSITVHRDTLVTMLPNKNIVEVNQTIQVISTNDDTTDTNQTTCSNGIYYIQLIYYSYIYNIYKID